MKEHSIFWPLTFIAAGVIWLLNGMGIIPSANLWALTHLLPFILIVLGLGLILRAYWRFGGMLTSLIVVGGTVLAIVFAPQLGWNDGPPMNWDIELGDFDGGSGAIKGSGEIVTETRKVSGFDAVSLEYPAKVTIHQGKTESVTLKGDDNLLPQILTDIDGGTLRIDTGERDWNDRVNPSKPLEVVITVKDLKQVRFPSAGSLTVEKLTTDSLEVVVSGAGDIALRDLDAGSLDVVLSGAGSVDADGVADDLSVRISGAGEFSGGDLHSQTAEVHISGMGSATVWVDKELDASISGAGSVNYYGDPSVQEQISGAGDVKGLGEK
ncbi:MAG: DUF2807 domain-containing protein [Chloroflexi bacterium]|nr:DUF2807 domain-containing protein [Chloroflexota bacterium]